MRRILIKSAAALLLTPLAIGAIVYQGSAAARPPLAARSQPLPSIGTFTAGIYAGPDRGFSLTGVFLGRVDTAGRFTGQIAPKGRAPIPVSGQVNGLAINLVFYLGAGKHIFGVGTLGQDPGATRAFAGGPLVGPRKGDTGDWDAYGSSIHPHLWSISP